MGWGPAGPGRTWEVREWEASSSGRGVASGTGEDGMNFRCRSPLSALSVHPRPTSRPCGPRPPRCSHVEHARPDSKPKAVRLTPIPPPERVAPHIHGHGRRASRMRIGSWLISPPPMLSHARPAGGPFLLVTATAHGAWIGRRLSLLLALLPLTFPFPSLRAFQGAPRG